MARRRKKKKLLTKRDWIFEIITAIALIVTLSLTVSYWHEASKITSANNIADQPDVYDFGGRITLLILSILSIIGYAGFTIVNFYPRIFNFSTEATSAAAASLYQLATRIIRITKLIIVGVFLFLVWFQYSNVPKTDQSSSNLLFMIVMIGILVVIIGNIVIGIFKMGTKSR